MYKIRANEAYLAQFFTAIAALIIQKQCYLFDSLIFYKFIWKKTENLVL